jgi:hypothetical protein
MPALPSLYVVSLTDGLVWFGPGCSPIIIRRTPPRCGCGSPWCWSPGVAADVADLHRLARELNHHAKKSPTGRA